MIVVLGFILLLIAAIKWKRMKDMYFLAGAFLFMLVLTIGIRIGLKNGFDTVISGDEFDKSYFNVCIPFFLFIIHEIKKKKFDSSGYHFDY